jgi:CubicO group peptidase (beta-lactamase class C family)
VAVVHRGRIIAERCGHGAGTQTPLLGWSMTKSVTATIIGLLIQQGKLELEDPAPVPEWRDDGRQKITLASLQRMSSGLEFSEKYVPFYDATEMLYESADMAQYAVDKPLRHPVDTVFNYSSGTTNILMRIARQATGGELVDLQRFVMEELFRPLRMHSAVLEPDASGNFVGSSYMFATARDWARLGLLYLNEGRWGDRQLLSREFVRFCREPVPFAPRRRYGGQWHLNVGEQQNPEDRNLPSLPTTLYYMNGFNEQHVVVAPEHDLVLVRLGATQDETAWSLEKFLGLVLSSVKAGGR